MEGGDVTFGRNADRTGQARERESKAKSCFGKEARRHGGFTDMVGL